MAQGQKKGDPGVPVPLRKGQMALMAYDLKKDGSAKFRKTLVDYAPQDGPDGLVVDANGNLLFELKAVPGSMFMIRTEKNWPTLRHLISLPTLGLVGERMPICSTLLQVIAFIQFV